MVKAEEVITCVCSYIVPSFLLIIPLGLSKNLAARDLGELQAIPEELR